MRRQAGHAGLSDRYSTASRLWDQHLAAEFPAELRGAVLDRTDMTLLDPAAARVSDFLLDGADLVLLDSYTAGSVLTWLGNGGHLDGEQHRILLELLDDLDQAVPLIANPYGRFYYTRLRDLARLISLPDDSAPDPLKQ